MQLITTRVWNHSFAIDMGSRTVTERGFTSRITRLGSPTMIVHSYCDGRKAGQGEHVFLTAIDSSRIENMVKKFLMRSGYMSGEEFDSARGPHYVIAAIDDYMKASTHTEEFRSPVTGGKRKIKVEVIRPEPELHLWKIIGDNGFPNWELNGAGGISFGFCDSDHMPPGHEFSNLWARFSSYPRGATGIYPLAWFNALLVEFIRKN